MEADEERYFDAYRPAIASSPEDNMDGSYITESSQNLRDMHSRFLCENQPITTNLDRLTVIHQ